MVMAVDPEPFDTNVCGIPPSRGTLAGVSSRPLAGPDSIVSRRGPEFDPVRKSRKVTEGRFHIRWHRLRSVRGLPVQQERHDSDRGRGLEIVEPIVNEDTVHGLDSESMRDLLPVPGLSFLRVLRMAREDPVDYVEQASAAESRVV